MTTPVRRDDSPVSDEQRPPTAAVLPEAPTRPTNVFIDPIAAPPAMNDLSGTFGRYSILRKLGKGGMGRVYLAHDPHLDRQVAIKVPQLDGSDVGQLRERFAREAKAAANLRHPNICPVYDVGSVGDTPYLTMAFIDGQTLFEWATTSPRTVGDILEMVQKIALALDEAHLQGIIHRDLKPSNVLVDRRGEPVVMDFGLARRLHIPEEVRITSPGMLTGTPAYMPPEQVMGEAEASTLTDIYSLGVILYELLAGRCPHVGPVTALLARIVTDPVEPPSRWRPDLHPNLDTLCLRALARKPADRFSDMARFAHALTDARSVAAPSTQRVATPPAPTVQQRPVPTRKPVDADLAPRILDMLRRWGWARGTQKIKFLIRGCETDSRGAAWQRYLDWMSGDRDLDSNTLAAFEALPCARALRGWALAGQASRFLRDRNYPGALKQLEKAESLGDPTDTALQATIAHTRAGALVHCGKCDEALPHLHQALDLFGREHFMTGRVLDTLGMAYAYKGNFPIAKELYEASIRCKEQCDDDAGIAISHGQLGRLYLAWEHLDEAEHHFQEDLRLAQRLRSRWSEAQIYNHMGQLALARAERDGRAGKKAAARRQVQAASGWLEQAIRVAKEERFAIPEGFARKDRALAYIHEGQLTDAWEQTRLALILFDQEEFQEGTAKVNMVEGLILQREARWQEAERKFRNCLTYFENTNEADEAVRALRAIARTQRDGGAPTPIVTRSYIDALKRAESSRHDPLVRDIEQELHEVDIEAYLRHIYRRARGIGVDEDSPSLFDGTCEVGTLLSVDLPGFAEYFLKLGPESALVTFNHLLADFADVLARHQTHVLAYRGSGLLALAREVRHAERGVRAALALVAAVEEFNRPRQLLGLPRFTVRIGIASGDVLLGNVGTYLKMDYTVLGLTVNVSAALRNEAQPGVPCLARSTYEAVRDRFTWRTEPRLVSVAGVGQVEAWDVERPKGA